MPATIKGYFVAVQIMKRHPEPREASTLSCLRLVQQGARRDWAELPTTTHRLARLRIMLPLLRLLHPLSDSPSYSKCLLWAATVCFFGFFRAGKINQCESMFGARFNLGGHQMSARTIRLCRGGLKLTSS